MINHQTTIATGSTSSSRNIIQENPNPHYQDEDDDEAPAIRDIHPLTPPHPQRVPRREAWETSSHGSSSLSMASNSENSENFTSMSREFNALVLAGSNINQLGRIREEDHFHEETNPLAIVPDNTPLDSAAAAGGGGELILSNIINSSGGDHHRNISVHSVKKEEVESKINAWMNAKIAKINNRFKRDDAIINGWETEQVQKATSRMKRVERKLEAKRAKATEKMQNEIAKAHRKAEERRASAEAKRGTKVAGVVEVANLMKAVGRAPVKRSFF